MIIGVIRFLLGLIVGVVLFIPLTLIPILGPLFTGFVSARIARIGVTRSIILGFLISGIGFLAWILFIYPKVTSVLDPTLSWIFLWVFVIWNITSVIFTIAGAVIAGIQTTTENIKVMSRGFGGMGFANNGPDVASTECDITETLIVCPNCGSGNPEDAAVCNFCGAEIKSSEAPDGGE